MAAPSVEHESRVSLLEALAVLAGFSATGVYGGGAIPDVVRIDVRHRRLLIADAKHTERPSDAETLHRLQRYFIHTFDWRKWGFEVTVAICFDISRSTPTEWIDAVKHLADISGVVLGHVDSRELSPADGLVWCGLAREGLAQIA